MKAASSNSGRLKSSRCSAILLYLAEKTGKFLPAKTDKARSELLSWMFFVSSGVGPYFGQSVHFRVYAPEKISYATNRYAFEAQRHAGILDVRLGKQKYMLGDAYTIVDMNVWGWARLIPTVLGDGAWDKFPNLKRLVDEISARPAAQRAMALKDRHKFKTEMDAEAMRAMFPHLNVKVAVIRIAAARARLAAIVESAVHFDRRLPVRFAHARQGRRRPRLRC
jgi:GSH-dependent disulfide-bond oxidoreductase